MGNDNDTSKLGNDDDTSKLGNDDDTSKLGNDKKSMPCLDTQCDACISKMKKYGAPSSINGTKDNDISISNEKIYFKCQWQKYVIWLYM